MQDDDANMQIALNESLITTARKDNMTKTKSHESPPNDSVDLNEDFFQKYEPINAEDR